MGFLAVLSVIGAVAQGEQTKTIGQQKKSEAKIQAAQSKLGATQREADRKSRLADALASQNATSGARSIAAFEGSPLTILQADIEREEVATERDKFSSELEQFTGLARGSSAKRQARTSANIGLLQAGTSFAQASVTRTSATEAAAARNKALTGVSESNANLAASNKALTKALKKK